MANRVMALRELRDLMLHLTLFWALIAISVQFAFPTARIWVVIAMIFSGFLLFFGEVILRFAPQK